MFKNLLQKVFNFGLQEEVKVNKATFKEEPSQAQQKKHDKLSECCSLLREAQNQKNEKRGAEALITLEKIIDMMEREEL